MLEKITGREDVEVLVDPTMLLNKEEWEKISKKPEQIQTNESYILKYFLGELDEKDKNELESFAIKHKCKIIDIADPNNPYHDIGPSEFIYLEKNAKFIITDSFHSCVFAILFGIPFSIYKRIDNDNPAMYSRMETLLKKFNLNNIEYNGILNDSILKVNIKDIEKNLREERKKAKLYLDRVMNSKE